MHHRGLLEDVTVEKLKQFTWIVRRQISWSRSYEYSIELKELNGCIGYGDSYKKAKDDLLVATTLWLKHHNFNRLPKKEICSHMLVIEKPMTIDEFEEINIVVKSWDE